MPSHHSGKYFTDPFHCEGANYSAAHETSVHKTCQGCLCLLLICALSEVWLEFPDRGLWERKGLIAQVDIEADSE